MIKGENSSDSIPIDLISEILSRLPAKSIARFCCVSKLWGSMFLRPYFAGLFLTRSAARPHRLLFALEGVGDEWCFFTSPQPHIPYEKSPSLVVAADFHMKFHGYESYDKWLEFRGRASGLIYFRRAYTALSEKNYVKFDPRTGHYLPIPKERRGDWRSFLGFDPIDKQFKVFSIGFPDYDKERENQYKILTLGTRNDSWRKIHCPLNHVCTYHLPGGICINGVLFYLAQTIDGGFPYVLVCFDVRSEKFRFIYRDFVFYQHDVIELFNYKGKLGVITLKHDYNTRTLKVCMWVINDVEKQDSEWPKYFSFCWNDKVADFYERLRWSESPPSIVGVTAIGEIVFSMKVASTPFYVFYLNPEKNTIQRVEIQGFAANQIDSEGDPIRVEVFVDCVEDLNFIIMKKTDNAMISPEQKREPTSTSTTSSQVHLQQEDVVGLRALTNLILCVFWILMMILPDCFSCSLFIIQVVCSLCKQSSSYHLSKKFLQK